MQVKIGKQDLLALNKILKEVKFSEEQVLFYNINNQIKARIQIRQFKVMDEMVFEFVN